MSHDVTESETATKGKRDIEVDSLSASFTAAANNECIQIPIGINSNSDWIDLLLLACHGKVECLRVVINAGANVDAEDYARNTNIRACR